MRARIRSDVSNTCEPSLVAPPLNSHRLGRDSCCAYCRMGPFPAERISKAVMVFNFELTMQRRGTQTAIDNTNRAGNLPRQDFTHSRTNPATSIPRFHAGEYDVAGALIRHLE